MTAPEIDLTDVARIGVYDERGELVGQCLAEAFQYLPAKDAHGRSWSAQDLILDIPRDGLVGCLDAQGHFLLMIPPMVDQPYAIVAQGLRPEPDPLDRLSLEETTTVPWDALDSDAQAQMWEQALDDAKAPLWNVQAPRSANVPSVHVNTLLAAIARAYDSPIPTRRLDQASQWIYDNQGPRGT